MRTIVLTGKGNTGLVEGIHGHIDEAFYVCSSSISCHGGRSKGINGGLNQHIGNGKNNALHTGWDADAKNTFQLIFVNAKLMKDEKYAEALCAEANGLLEIYCARADETYAAVLAKLK